ncbi:MAG TPA: DUF2142 domain-containing protein [Solirubrobacteraceae bacterium]|jgi:hypothetical protein
MAVALALAMSHSPPDVARTNAVPIDEVIAVAPPAFAACQGSEVLPRGTTAVRLSLEALLGPRVTVRIVRKGAVLSTGERAAGWSKQSVTVPVRALRRSVANVSLCFALAPHDETVNIKGKAAGRRPDGSVTGGRIRIEYLRPGKRSWWGLIPMVARRMSWGHATSGVWIVLAVLVTMVALAAIVSLLLVRDPRSSERTVRRRPRCWSLRLDYTTAFHRFPLVAWIMLVACLNAACWSIVSPPFEVVDELAHFSYVKQLAETGQLPRVIEGQASQEEAIAAKDLHYLATNEESGRDPIESQTEQNQLQHDLLSASRLPRDGSKAAGVATSEPPLYYTLEAIPYRIAYRGTLLARLQLMRLLSALMAAFTALFVYLFAREALPAVPRAWTVAGLGVALAPLVGSMSGAINPDAMLYAVSAALFYCFARAFRRGLTRRLAGAIGATIGIGLLTKLNFIGLLPGASIGLMMLVVRVARQTSVRAACWRLALACGIAAGLVLLVALAIVLTGNRQLHALGGDLSGYNRPGSLMSEVGYIWQTYLPRLPGMTNDFPGIFPGRQLWFNNFIGLYGWGDTVFPNWVYEVVMIPVAAIACLCCRAVFVGRAALRGRWTELLVYLLISIGVMTMVAIASYSNFPRIDAEYGRTRYLFPMLALLGAILALAARGAGRRWHPSAAVLIVMLVLAHDIFSQLLVISRYYG